MDLKYTIEILTKDIQDIEKLVAGLQKSQDTSTLELDLTLSKLRNVYDVLSSIRDDMTLRSGTPERDQPITPVVEPSSVKPEPFSAGQQEAGKIPAPEPEVEAAPEPEAAQVPEPEQKPGEAPVSGPSPEPETVAQGEDAAEPEVAPEPEATPVSEATQEPKAESVGKETVESREMSTRKHAEILADKFMGEASINENLATSREKALESKLAGKPIDSISKNIGINDRFMIIRELYEGDSEALGKLINNLDQAGSLDAALSLLDQAIGKHTGHEGMDILRNLVRRRYSQ